MPSTTPLTDAITALTTYANTITGASDTTLSDAVDTLVDGYGGGGGGITKVTGTVTGNGTKTISIPCSAKPLIVLAYRSDIKSVSAVDDRSHDVTLAYDGIFIASAYSAANAIAVAASGAIAGADFAATTAPGINRIGYMNGTLYITSGNNSNLWSTSLTYNYVLFFE